MNKEIKRNKIYALPLSSTNLSYSIEVLLLNFTPDDKIQLTMNESTLLLPPPSYQLQDIKVQDISCSQFTQAKLYTVKASLNDDIQYDLKIISESKISSSGAKFAIRNFQFTYQPADKNQCFFTCGDCKLSQKNVCLSCDEAYSKRKLNADGKCLCPEGYYEAVEYKCLQDTLKCPDTCKTCKSTSPKVCLDCDTQYNRTLKQGICVCKDGFYQKLNNKLCMACSLQCKTCLSDSKRCIICADFRIKDAQGNCVCQKGYYENNGTCASCAIGCDNCTDGQKCTSCKSLNMQIVNGICQCLDSYYLEGSSATCKPCPYSCRKCKNTSECTECKTEQGYILQINNCVCPSQNFDNGKQCIKCMQRCNICSKLDSCDTCLQPYDFKNGQCLCKDGFYESALQECLPCSEKCKTCGNSVKCLSCKNPDQFISDNSNQCVCKDGTYEDQQLKICQQCNSKCQKCTDLNKCTECKIDSGLVLIDNQCVCKSDEYFDSNNLVCKKCQKNCLQCLSETKCLKCINDGEYLYDSANYQCDCQEGFYRDEFEDKYSCFKCHYSCKSCIVFNICEECALAGAILDSFGNCECPIGYFKNLNSNPKKCEKCLDSCKTCNNGQYCTACINDQLYEMDKLGNCNCKKGYFMRDQQCFKCDELCKECSFEQLCTSCISPLMVIQIGKCQCPDGFYYEKFNQTCLRCSKFCKKCLDGNKCILCVDEDGYQLVNNSCQCIQNGYFQQIDGSCCPCEYSCQQCSDQKSCISCKYEGTFLDQKSKLCICGNGLNFDKVSNTCTKCFQGCKTCDSNKNCLECSDNVSQYLDQTEKQCKCRKGYFENDIGICQKCDEMCSECIERSDKCTACTYADTKLQENQCQCQKDSFYFDQSLKSCQPCNKLCKNCNNKDTCLSCLDNIYYEYQQQTGICKCSPNHYININNGLCNKCLYPLLIHENLYCQDQCPTGYYIFQNLCTKNCPENYVIVNGICKKTFCDSKTCRKCNKNQTDCDQCISNFHLMQDGYCKQCDQQNEYYNQSLKQCEKCDSTCDKCFGGSSSECIKCKFAKISYTNTCVSSCKKGEYPFEIKEEKVCKTCYLQEGLCRMDNCGLGYYINKENICVKCHKSCLTCKGDKSNQCLTCQDNLFLEQGRCLHCRYGFYFNQTESKCQECHYSCLECFGPNENQCIACSFSLLLSQISGKCVKNDQYEKEVDERMKADSIRCDSLDFSVCQEDIDFSKQTMEKLKMEIIVSASINSIFSIFFQKIYFQNIHYIEQNQLLGNLKNSDDIVAYGIFQNHLKLNSYFNILTLFESDSQQPKKDNKKYLIEDTQKDANQKEQRQLEKQEQENEQNSQERQFFISKCLIQLIGMVIIYLSILILHLIRNKSQTSLKCYEFFRWKLIIRYNMIFSNFVLYYAYKEIMLLEFSSIKSILSISTAILYVFLYLILLVSQFRFLFFQKSFADENLRTYYSVSFQQLKVEYVLQRLFWVLYDVKRLIVILLQVILKENTIFQIYMITSINGLFLFYLIIMRPIENTFLFFCCTVIEILSNSINAFLILLLKNPEDSSLSKYFIYSLFAYHAIALTMCLAQVIFSLIQIINQKRIQKKKEIQSSTNQVLMGFQLNVNIDSFLSQTPVKNLHGPKRLVLKKKIKIEMEKR